MAAVVKMSQARAMALGLLSVAIGSVAVALVALAISTLRPNTATPAPADVIEAFLSARQAHDVNAAATFFENDDYGFQRRSRARLGRSDTHF